MARHDSDERVINRREIKNAIAEYLYGSGYPIDVDHMGDYLFDRMARVPEAGCCRRCGDMRPALVDGMCACCVNELEHEKERRD